MPKIIKKKQNKKKQHGGDCGCQKENYITEGITGGNVNYINPINTFNNDPNNPSAVISTRIQPNTNTESFSFFSGGKKTQSKSKKMKHKTKKIKHKTKKMKGGSDTLLDSHNANLVSSFNTSLGSHSSPHVITGTNNIRMNSEPIFHVNTPFI